MGGWLSVGRLRFGGMVLGGSGYSCSYLSRLATFLLLLLAKDMFIIKIYN